MQPVKGIMSMKKYLFPKTVSLPVVTQSSLKCQDNEKEDMIKTE